MTKEFPRSNDRFFRQKKPQPDQPWSSVIGTCSFVRDWTLIIGQSIAALIVFHYVSLTLSAAAKPSPEDAYYHILTLPIPPGIVLEAGALQLLPDGKLASATRFGDIYLIEGAFENPPAHLKFHHFASGNDSPVRGDHYVAVGLGGGYNVP